MKILLTFVLLIVAAFIAVQLFGMKSQNGIETYAYKVKKKYEDFEIREYESSLFTSVKLETGTYEESSRRGFSILAGYIFGGNDKQEKIAMTSPVAMSLEDSMTVMFMVPKENEIGTLPTPNDKNIAFRQEPAKTMAAITFGGWANDQKIASYKKQLQEALDREGIPFSDRFYFFGYNAPYETFNRRNEVIVELSDE